MKNSDVAKIIRKKHGYPVSSKNWPRIGMICSRYGVEVVHEAVETLDPLEVPIVHFFNIIEKRSQYILENDGMDEIASELLGLD